VPKNDDVIVGVDVGAKVVLAAYLHLQLRFTVVHWTGVGEGIRIGGDGPVTRPEVCSQCSRRVLVEEGLLLLDVLYEVRHVHQFVVLPGFAEDKRNVADGSDLVGEPALYRHLAGPREAMFHVDCLQLMRYLTR